MSRRRYAALALLLAVSLTACVQIPDSGPVRPADTPTGAAGDQGPRFVPRGPQQDDSPQELVTHFFEAMTASPMSATVAREFLTKDAAANWRPEEGFLTYSGKVSPTGYSRISVNLTGVSRFDSRGRWLGPAAGGELDLGFEIEVENGQLRIGSVPDRLMVSEAWFETQTLPMSVYFFDRSTRTLVPEPVYVPRGDQMPTLLIRSLLEGPTDRRVEQSFVPADADLILSVTVSPDGLAEIPLSGELANTPRGTVQLMATQFAWTLRQIPSISTVRITVDGEPVALDGGSTEFGVDLGANGDPAGVYARDDLYGLRSGLVVRVLDGDEQATTGPFGVRHYGLRDLSVNLEASRIAGVTRDGKRVLVSGFSVSEGDQPQRVFSRGVDLLQPAWDAADRLWSVDRRADGAAVSVLQDGRIQAVDVPGVSGRRVIDFLVSRDGTRLVAAVRRPGGDRIVVSRLYAAAAGGSLRATPARTIVDGDGERLVIRGIGWRSPTSIYYGNAMGGRQTNLRSALVDGSPALFDPEAYSGVFPDLGAGVVSSPRPEEPVYLQRTGGGYGSVLDGAPQIPEGLTALTYGG